MGYHNGMSLESSKEGTLKEVLKESYESKKSKREVLRKGQQRLENLNAITYLTLKLALDLRREQY